MEVGVARMDELIKKYKETEENLGQYQQWMLESIPESLCGIIERIMEEEYGVTYETCTEEQENASADIAKHLLFSQVFEGH